MTATKTRIPKEVRARVDAVLGHMPAGSEEKIRTMTAEDKDHKAIAARLKVPVLAVAKVQHVLELRDWSGNTAITGWAEGKKVLAAAKVAEAAATKTTVRKRVAAKR